MTDFLFEQFNGVPAWNWALQFVGLVASYIGAELNARMKVSGFWMWMVANMVLAIIHFTSGLWLLLVLDLLYLRVNLMGIARWSRTQPQATPRWVARLLGVAQRA